MWSAMFPMRWRYCYEKGQFAARIMRKRCNAGEITKGECSVLNPYAYELLDKKMTYLYYNKGAVEMESSLSPQDTLLVRKLPYVNVREHREQMNVGDVVVLKDPIVSGNRLVRRLAALGGCEMASTNNDKPFVMKPGQAWVLSDNNRLNPKESKDSRSYGPIRMSDILGRVIYRFKTPDDEGPVKNSERSMKWDLPVYSFELDREEMQRFSDKQK